MQILVIESRLQRGALRKASLQAQLNEQRLKIAQTAGHEHSTPLNGIIGFTNLLIDHYEELASVEAISMLEMIRSCSLRLKRSLDNVRLMDILKCVNPSHKEYLVVFTTGQTMINRDMVETQIELVESRQDEGINRQVDIVAAQLALSEDTPALF